MLRHNFTAFAGLFLMGAVALPTSSTAQEKEVASAGERNELKRGDLDGVNGMEIIVATTEYKPGTVVPRHIHHGNEAFYVLEGAMIEPFGGPPRMVQTRGGQHLSARFPPRWFQSGWRQASQAFDCSHRRQGQATLRRTERERPWLPLRMAPSKAEQHSLIMSD